MAVYDRLLESILSGRRKPGEPIRDRDIATEFGVSRTPVREAIQMLRSFGIVEASASRYTRVAQLGPVDVVQAGRLLFNLYGEVLRELAESGRPLPIADMEQQYESAIDAHRRGDTASFWTRVFEIHDNVFRQSRNLHLRRALRSVTYALRVAVLANAERLDPARVLKGNREVLDLLRGSGAMRGLDDLVTFLQIGEELTA